MLTKKDKTGNGFYTFVNLFNQSVGFEFLLKQK